MCTYIYTAYIATIEKHFEDTPKSRPHNTVRVLWCAAGVEGGGGVLNGGGAP